MLLNASLMLLYLMCLHPPIGLYSCVCMYPSVTPSIHQVRSAYCSEDFEWDTLQRVAIREMEDANQRLLQKHATESFSRSMGVAPGEWTAEQKW